MVLAVANTSYAQLWNTAGNNISTLTQYLGADAASTQPLRFTTFANYPHEWRPNNLLRMRLNATQLATIGAFTLQDVDGHLGVSKNGTGLSTLSPWTQIHLFGRSFNSWTGSYRPDQANSLTLTGNNDHLAFGQRVDATNSTRSFIRFSDGNPSASADAFSFLYTEDYSAGAPVGTPRHLLGRELARFTPAGNFGIGNWQAGANVPAERLDLLDGKVRIRQLPTDLPDPSADKVLMINPSGVVSAKVPTATDCRWRTGTFTGPNDLATCVNDPGLCTTDDDRVAIGTMLPIAKLSVFQRAAAGGSTFGTQSTVLGNAGAVCFAVSGTSEPNTGMALLDGCGTLGRSYDATRYNIGSQGWADLSNGRTNTFFQAGSKSQVDLAAGSTSTGRTAGAYGWVLSQAGSSAGLVAGVYGEAYAYATGNVTEQIAVSGRTNPNGLVNFAGRFDGNVFVNGVGTIPGGVWTSSDANLKTNIVSMDSAMYLIEQLQPSTYEYVPSAAPGINFPSGTQAGFLAQQLEAVIPNLVRDGMLPSERDSIGHIITPPTASKEVNYVGLIPYLVAAMKEQNTRIDQLEQQLTACCSSGQMNAHGMEQGANSTSTGTMDTDLRIVPNPVAASTQLRYTVGTPGRVRLEVSDNTGRVIEVLEEATRSTGNFTYEWNTQQLAAGTYFCTLYVNDEPLVKKAVKLNER